MMGLRPLDPRTGSHPVLGDGGGMFSIPSFPSDVHPDPEMIDDSPVLLRPGSSVAMLRGQHLEEDVGQPSWYEEEATSKRLSCCQVIRLCFDSLLLLAAGAGVVLAAYLPVDIERGLRHGGALPYVYAVFVAIAGYEFAWLAYRVRLKLFMPFKLHEKQTSREMYRQIIAYAVDEETSAVTPLAEKIFCGSKVVAALVMSTLAAGGAVGLCFVPGITQMPMIYVGVCTFVSTLSAALSPNMPTALCVLVRYAYFFLSAASGNGSGDFDDGLDSRHAMDKYLAVVVESYSLLLLGVCLLLVIRAVTSKDSVESTLMIVLDVTGLLYLSCSAAVLELFEQSTRVRASGALAGFFAIVWSSEIGAFLTARLLKAMQFPWMHPLSKHVSSQQNVEKMLGAIGFAVGAAFVASSFVEFDMNIEYVALVSAAAVICAHIGKLFLVSLKKIAKVSKTGSYLRVGGGVLDRLDTLLFMAVVFAPFFQRAVYNQPQW
ncbi:Cytidylyltransferase [Phytophthora megakarya]|uniref:Cytidylyltransferase n=1 Tax=Phytophthora megakarya TaxID=4795 RepID=A0A225WRB3_9STRA|nr:Cytidylyltransferase [Phytophthora megakarya]